MGKFREAKLGGEWERQRKNAGGEGRAILQGEDLSIETHSASKEDDLYRLLCLGGGDVPKRAAEKLSRAYQSYKERYVDEENARQRIKLSPSRGKTLRAVRRDAAHRYTCADNTGADTTLQAREGASVYSSEDLLFTMPRRGEQNSAAKTSFQNSYTEEAKSAPRFFSDRSTDAERSCGATVTQSEGQCLAFLWLGLVSFFLSLARVGGGAMPFGLALFCSAERGAFPIIIGYIFSAALRGDFFLTDIFMILTALIIRLAALYMLSGDMRPLGTGSSSRGGDSVAESKDSDSFIGKLGAGKGRENSMCKAIKAPVDDASFLSRINEILSLLFTLCEPLSFRMAAGSFCGFIFGMIRLVSGGFQAKLLTSALIMTALVPLLVWVFYALHEKTLRFSLRYDVALLLVGVGITLGLSGITFIGISLPIVWVSLMTLSAGARGGPLSGTVNGLVLGLAAGAALSPLFGIMGFISGAIRGCGAVLPLLSACGTGVVMAFILEGFPSLGETIPNLLWGAALYVPLARFGVISKIIPFGCQGDLPRELAFDAILAEQREKSDSERLKAMSEAMSSLSGVFSEMAEKLSRPDISEMRSICEKALKKHCTSCPSLSVCFGEKYSQTADVLNKLARATLREGQCEKEFALAEFFERCPHVMRTVSEVNLIYARRLEAAARENRTAIFALDYEAMARLMKSAAEDRAEEGKCDSKLSERARHAAVQLGIRAENVAVIGKRQKTLILSGLPFSTGKSARAISDGFSEALGVRLGRPCFDIRGDYVTMTASSLPILSVSCGRAQQKKQGEEISGDACSYFTSRDMLYGIICDGMGSGNSAALTSRVTVMFLQKMLAAGNKMSIVIKMLSDFVRNKNLECFTTLDLLWIDLFSGRAGFVKSGAACSYILRAGRLFRLSSNSLPLGITREITAEEIKMRLSPRDTVIMISDGVAQGAEDGAWLAELLSCELDSSLPPGQMADFIMSEAKRHGSRTDDMTVLVIKVDGV